MLENILEKTKTERKNSDILNVVQIKPGIKVKKNTYYIQTNHIMAS